MTDNRPSVGAENDQDLPKESDSHLSEVQTYVQDFPIKQLNVLDNAGRYSFRFGFELWRFYQGWAVETSSLL